LGKCLSKALWEWGKCLPIPFLEAFAGLGNEVKLGFSASLQCALFQSTENGIHILQVAGSSVDSKLLTQRFDPFSLQNVPAD